MSLKMTYTGQNDSVNCTPNVVLTVAILHRPRHVVCGGDTAGVIVGLVTPTAGVYTNQPAFGTIGAIAPCNTDSAAVDGSVASYPLRNTPHQRPRRVCWRDLFRVPRRLLLFVPSGRVTSTPKPMMQTLRSQLVRMCIAAEPLTQTLASTPMARSRALVPLAQSDICTHVSPLRALAWRSFGSIKREKEKKKMANLSRTQQQTAMLGQFLKTAGGRQKLAASLGPSFRRRRDYMRIARKALMVETLPDGALPIYDKEFDTAAMTVGSTPGSSFVEAFVVGEEGGDIVRVTKPKRVTVPTFEIVSNPMIPITQIKERRFDFVARSLNLAKAEVGAAEDGYVFTLFDAVATAAAGKATNDPVYNVDIAIGAPIDINSMADGFGQVQRHDLSVAFVLLQPA